jgi:transcription-repair coupling factor (superfamily II helicase)
VYRSLKEAASELDARIRAGRDRRFPVMGLKGAAGALMLRETVLRLERPLVAIAPRANEAEALAHELKYFLGQSEDSDAGSNRVHHLPAWEIRPFAHVSPPSDIQGAQVAALYSMLRQPAPVVISSVEALMMRTIPRATLNDSIVRVSVGDRLDLETLIDALTTAGYQRIPQAEEPGDFSVRGGIVDVFSPLLSAPVRIEMEDDRVTSIRRFEPASQRSAGAIQEAAIVRTRFVASASLRVTRVGAAVAVRAADLGMVRKEVAELEETLANGLLFPGVELLMPYLFEAPLEPIFNYVPDDAIWWLLDPGRLVAEAQKYSEKIAAEAAAAAEKHSFHSDPASLYLGADEFENALANQVAVEVGAVRRPCGAEFRTARQPA